MPIAHVCTACGESMAFVRAVPDPHYSLPIVQCPNCGTAAIRHRHPGRAAWNSTLRMGTTYLALAVQLALLSAALMATVACTVPGGVILAYFLGIQPAFFETLDIDDLSHSPRELVLMTMFLWVLAPIAIGSWLNTAYGHLSWRTRWLTWCIVLVGSALITFGVVRLLVMPTMLAQPYMQGPNDPTPEVVYAAMRSMLIWWLIGFTIFSSIAQIGIVPATVLRRLHSSFVRIRFRMRRRTRRAARTAHS